MVLNSFAHDGEDLFLLEVSKQLGQIEKLSFLEFGAWDGVYLSNCALLAQAGMPGVFIEALPKRFKSLRKNYEGFEEVRCINAFVESKDGHLVNLLKVHNIIPEFDIVSIDIDGDDLEVFERSGLSPSVLVMEYNPTIPRDLLVRNSQRAGIGNSFLSITNSLNKLGYVLLREYRTNLLFVRGDLLQKFSKLVESPMIARVGYFFSYDGALIEANENGLSLADLFRVPWGSTIARQPVSRAFRRFRPLGSPVAIAWTFLSNLPFLLFHRGERGKLLRHMVLGWLKLRRETREKQALWKSML